jgi:putative membrane protein insertion efficiency factor
MATEPGSRQPAPLSAAQHSALAFLKLYKIVLSPLFAGSCRFVPSCSDYASEAVTVHGALKGSWLAVCRLSRCHPWGSSGLDQVPGRPTRVQSTRMF